MERAEECGRSCKRATESVLWHKGLRVDGRSHPEQVIIQLLLASDNMGAMEPEEDSG
jgi:hypothetical protein